MNVRIPNNYNNQIMKHNIYTGCLKIASTKKNLVIGDGELKSSAKENSNKNPLVFEIKITKNWVKIVSAPLS
jgi:hypothetical protein